MKKQLFFIFLFCFLTQIADAQVDDEVIDHTIIQKSEEDKKIKEKNNFFKVDNIFVGTTFSFILGQYMFIDISPYAGYLFGKHFGVGIGGTYIYSAFFAPGGTTATDNVYGGRLFVNIRPFDKIRGLSGLYAHVEGEFLNREVSAFKRENIPAVNVGIGYNTAFDKGFAFTAELLVNALWFSQVNQGLFPVYNSPWQYRIGIYYAF